MIGLPDENVLQLAVQRFTEMGKRFQIDVAGCTRIEAVDKIFGHTRYFGQFAKGGAFAGFGLLLSE
jgi:hypothetical protein